jgi:hypothetical protein
VETIMKAAMETAVEATHAHVHPAHAAAHVHSTHTAASLG